MFYIIDKGFKSKDCIEIVSEYWTDRIYSVRTNGTNDELTVIR